MNDEQKEQILKFVAAELSRISFGKLYIEMTVANNKVTNVQCETKRSLNINERPLSAH
jgi:hypothetical protein